LNGGVARIAVVLGAGGSVGHAFHAGVLAAIHDRFAWDARRADVLVGTSAGSLVAALLRAGMPAGDLARRAQRQPLSAAGQAVVERSGLGPPGSAVPPRRPPRGGVASPAALRRAARAPWTINAGSLAAAALPAGTLSTDQIAAPFRALFGERWPDDATWIVAVQLDTGRRIVFGRDPEAPATVADAVRASCAIPAFFQPVEIGGHRYVDGGVHSTTNADVVAEARPDLVVVSAPMSTVRGASRGRELPMRQFARVSLAREVVQLRARRIPVVVFHPTSADLEVMRGDALDPRKSAPVCERVYETASARLARSDVSERLRLLAG
jgi:NTE family protein